VAQSQLYVVHRVLICSAIALGALFAVYSGARYGATGQGLALVLCLLSAAVTVALAVYFRWFVRRHPQASSRE
jgi:hypothetical protein